MKSKQLANVLIKILGLSVCIHAIPSFISNIVFGFASLTAARWDSGAMRIMSSMIGTAVEAVVGIVLIAGSRGISEFLFKHDEE